MPAALEGLCTAAMRLGEAHDVTLDACRALDGLSDPLFDGARAALVRIDEVYQAVVRARDALDRAGA